MAFDPLTHCARCRRPAPPVDADEYVTWEVLTDDEGQVAGFICAGCVTGEEQRSIDEDMEALDIEAQAAKARELHPEAPDEGA